jgi:hypothetical protein
MRFTVTLAAIAAGGLLFAAVSGPPTVPPTELHVGTAAGSTGVEVEPEDGTPRFDGRLYPNPDTGCFDLHPGDQAEGTDPPPGDPSLLDPGPAQRGPWPLCEAPSETLVKVEPATPDG